VLAELEERALVARANRGEAAALETLYRETRDWVLGLAHRLTGNPADALDVMQETFLWFFGRFPGFKLTSSLRSFLYPVVKHQAIAIARRRRHDAPAAPELGWTLPGEEHGDFHRMLAVLPAEQRDVVTLRFGLDFKLEEIAEALAIPLGTVKSRLHNALKVLLAQQKSDPR